MERYELLIGSWTPPQNYKFPSHRECIGCGKKTAYHYAIFSDGLAAEVALVALLRKACLCMDTAPLRDCLGDATSHLLRCIRQICSSLMPTNVSFSPNTN